MNVYDFDKTIYKGDSTLDFYLFCLKQQPLLILLLPLQIFSFIQYKLGLIKKLQFKERFYIFLKYVKKREIILSDFWTINRHKIQLWYLNQKGTDDLIISASPEFLLKPICDELGIKNLIASKVDFNTGKCLGENCYGVEKTKRYREQFKGTTVNEFYSDSLTDAPMAEMAKRSFGVIGDVLVPWEEFECMPKSNSTGKEFLLFIIVGIVNTFNGAVLATIFTFFFNGTIAFILGYALSLTISYLLNSFFVFKHTLSYVKFLKFCVSYIPNFLIQLIMVLIFLRYLQVQEFLVYTISAILGVPITFLMVKFFALKK